MIRDLLKIAALIIIVAYVVATACYGLASLLLWGTGW
jgi:hypothetical protein